MPKPNARKKNPRIERRVVHLQSQVTPSEVMQIDAYCEAASCSVSSLLRTATMYYLQQENNR